MGNVIGKGESLALDFFLNLLWKMMEFYYLFIYLFLAALGLHCCTRALPSCDERGLLLVAMCGPPILVASPAVEYGLQARRPQQMWHSGSGAMAHGLSCSAACGILPDQGWNLCPLSRQADS